MERILCFSGKGLDTNAWEQNKADAPQKRQLRGCPWSSVGTLGCAIPKQSSPWLCTDGIFPQYIPPNAASEALNSVSFPTIRKDQKGTCLPRSPLWWFTFGREWEVSNHWENPWGGTSPVAWSWLCVLPALLPTPDLPHCLETCCCSCL